MAIEMRMDTPAIERLIGDDKEMRIALRRGVIHNIIRGSVASDLDGDTRNIVAQAALDVTAEVRANAAALLRDETQIVASIETRVARELETAIRLGNDKAQRGIDAAVLTGIEVRVRSMVNHALDEKKAEVEEAIAAKIETALAKMLAGLEESWKAAALAQIRADVVAKLNGALAS